MALPGLKSWLLIALCGAAGCNSGPRIVDVKGSITYKGKPIPVGEIRFIPIEGTLGPVTGAPIFNGHYQSVGQNGVPVGKHRVLINAYSKGEPRKAQSPPVSLEDTPASIQYLPEKFNNRSTLEVIIPDKGGVVTHDFNLD